MMGLNLELQILASGVHSDEELLNCSKGLVERSGELFSHGVSLELNLIAGWTNRSSSTSAIVGLRIV